ncbi:putative IQ calmodulin-binding motif containing protein [Leishmania naiffi]|uniref:IQ calmodulin-binding motif containing protein n=1 Tax=Leishmania naiffi TaxID=5678 RepID=A0AAW3CCK4_9TRYP
MHPLQRHSGAPACLASCARAPLAPRSHAQPSRQQLPAHRGVDLIQSAYAVLYKVHAHATQLVEEAEAYLTSTYGGTVTAAFKAKAQLYNPTPLKKDNTAAIAAESLLQRCLTMQALLELEGSNAAVSPSAAKDLANALSALVACLPLDWQTLVVKPENVPAGGVSAAALVAPEVAAATPTQQAPTSTADGSRIAVSSTKHGTSAHAVGSLVTSPTDLVQLALLLRRRWTLQRDLNLLVVALRDICAVVAAGGEAASSENNLRMSSAEDVPPPLMTVAVTLAMLQLPRMPAMLEVHEERMQVGRLPAGGIADATSAYPHPCPATVLPVWLWRASCATKSQHSEGVKMTAVPAAVVVAALASARQITKQVFKWEAHVARYVTAVLAAPSSVSPQGQQPGSARGGVGSPTEASVMSLLHKSDKDFLFDVQVDMSLERGACNEVQLLWLTAAAAALGTAAGASCGGALAAAGVEKRCSKLERTLRTISTGSAVARALLPGVLLLLGCAAACRRHGPENPASDASSRGLQYWMEAHVLGRQVLGSAHPVAVAVAALLPSSAVAASGERQPSASAPASFTAAHMQAAMPTLSNGRNSDMTCLSGKDVALPLHSQLQQQQSRAEAGTLTRLPPLPPVPASALRPPQHAPLFATSAPLRLEPASSPLASSRPLPALAASHPCLTRPPQSPPYPSLSLQSAQTSVITTATAWSSKGDPPPPLRHTFPLPYTPSSTVAAVDGAATQFCRPSPRSSLSALKPPGGRSLRHCHRLQRPEDAFALRSVVKDATLPAGDKDGAAAKKKNAARRLKNSKGSPQSSTAALLLSAISSKSAGAAGTLTSAVSSDSDRRRQLKRDRKFLPAPGPPASLLSAASTSTLPQPKEQPESKQQQQQEGVQEPQQDELYKGAPLDLDATAQGVQVIEPEAEQQDSSRSGGAADTESIGASASPTPAPVITTDQQCGLVLMSSHGNINMQPKGDGDAPDPHLAEAAGTDAENAEEEEEEEEEETLPERNARFQREIISYYAELNERRAKAALTIQLAWRSSKARQRLHVRRQALYQYVYTIQKAAALAIDGFLSCVLEQRRREAALCARTLADKRRLDQEQKEVAAAQRLTRAMCQWLQRQRERHRLCKELGITHGARLRLYMITAVKVQQWWRRVVVQRAYWRRHNVEMEEKHRLEAEAIRQAHAAVTIQTRVRGIQARSRVAQLRETRKAEALELRRCRDSATTVLAIVLQEYAKRQGRRHREALAQEESRAKAAQRITVGWRRTVGRRRLDLAVKRARQLRTSATCIQQVWRRYAAGSQRRYLRQLRHTVQEERLEREARTYEVIRLLQCFGRSAQAQLLVRRLKACQGRTFMENLYLIQAAGRGALARAEMRRMQVAEKARQRAAAAALEIRRLRATSLVQALLRAHVSTALVLQWRRTTLAEKLVVRATAAREMREDTAATVLQRAVRRHQMRQRTAAAEAEAAAALAFLSAMAHRLQQAWRTFAARRERCCRAAAANQCARKRLEWEEVWQLIWQDQFTELDLLCVIERHYIEEQQHVERVRLYSYLCNPDDATNDKRGAETCGAPNADADVLKWAALYEE